MKIEEIKPPREFDVGFPEHRVTLKECARITLKPDELVTFYTGSSNEYDVVRKDWGFYATPSLNGRLIRHHLRAYLVKNRIEQFYILLVEEGKESEFIEYLHQEDMEIIAPMFEAVHFKEIEKLVHYEISP